MIKSTILPHELLILMRIFSKFLSIDVIYSFCFLTPNSIGLHGNPTSIFIWFLPDVNSPWLLFETINLKLPSNQKIQQKFAQENGLYLVIIIAVSILEMRCLRWSGYLLSRRKLWNILNWEFTAWCNIYFYFNQTTFTSTFRIY